MGLNTTIVYHYTGQFLTQWFTWKKWTEWATSPWNKPFVPSSIVSASFNHPHYKYQQASRGDVYWAANTPFVFENWINRGILESRLTVTFIYPLWSEEFKVLYNIQRSPYNSNFCKISFTPWKTMLELDKVQR